MKHNEQKIIQLLKEGHNSAYQYIYENYCPLLCSIAYEIVGDDIVSKLLVDELITHLWEKRKTLEINTCIQNYLIRAIRNRCIDYLKNEHKRREISFSSLSISDDGGDENEFFSSSEIAYSPLDILLENELMGKISQAIDDLPAVCRKIFKMSRYEGKNYKQIAKEAKISVNAVKYHIKNALRMLRKFLKKYLQ